MLDILSKELIERYEGEAISAEKEICEKVNKALKNSHAPRRWFWELLQNAVDTISDEVDRKVSVTLNLKHTAEGPVLVFSHDGNPFREPRNKYRFDDFKNLINPTSGKAPKDESTIGKFGTGFLSTHILSLKIDVKGIFEISKDLSIPISTTLDRTGFISESENDRTLRIESLIRSLDIYEKSKENGGRVDGYPKAEFTYHLNVNSLEEGETTLKYVEEGIKEIEHSLPFVYAFNKKIASILITNELTANRNITEYVNCNSDEKLDQKIEIHKTEKRINGEKTKTFYVGVLKNDEVEVAWKVQVSKDTKYKYDLVDSRKEYIEDLGYEMAGLFCAFPLTGSHSFKFPLVINSTKFKPNETRDGISLTVADKANKALINEAIILYTEYLSVSSLHFDSIYNIADTLNEVKADHTWIDKLWYDQKIDETRKIIIKTPIITVHGIEGRVAIKSENEASQIRFPKLVLETSVKPEWQDSFYDLYNKLFSDCVPIKSELGNWLSVLWDSSDIGLVSIKGLLDKIQEYNDLKEFSKFFIKEVSEDADNRREVEAKAWLIELYNFIVTDLNLVSLLDYSIKYPNKGIVLTRSQNFKRFQELNRGVGFNGQIIDDELIQILDDFNPHYNYGNQLIDESLSTVTELVTLKIEEKSIVNLIIACAEIDMKAHDLLLKKMNDVGLNEAENLNKIIIEKKLSKLQNWIAQKNADRKYFGDYFKRKVLQAIIDEKKSAFLTKLLELDRSEAITLERQTQVLSDPDLEEKLTLGHEFLQFQKEKEDQDKQKRERGAHFENLFKELLKMNGISYNKVDGEQDFILFPSTINEKYVELKSISQSSNQISLTPEQATKAIKKGTNYFLCVIPNSGNHQDFSMDDFLKMAVFTNELKASLEKCIFHTESFEKSENGIRGEFPTAILSRLRAKPYYLNVEKEAWGKLNFTDFLQYIS